MVQRFGALLAPQFLPPDIKKMANFQIAFFWQFCDLKRSVIPPISFPGYYPKGNGCIGGGPRSLASCIACPTCLKTTEILRDMPRIRNNSSYGNWASDIVKQYKHLAMALPLSSCGITGLNLPGFQAKTERVSSARFGMVYMSPRELPIYTEQPR